MATERVCQGEDHLIKTRHRELKRMNTGEIREKTKIAEYNSEDRKDLVEGEPQDFEDFVEVVARLRAPDGCVWDKAQTHETLKKYLVEETQEALDAIDKSDDENLCEELGDVLLQIVLHAQIASERGAFTIGDVIQGISDKMIHRHPWVFGDMEIDSIEANVDMWEKIKAEEKTKAKDKTNA